MSLKSGLVGIHIIVQMNGLQWSSNEVRKQTTYQSGLAERVLRIPVSYRHKSLGASHEKNTLLQYGKLIGSSNVKVQIDESKATDSSIWQIKRFFITAYFVERRESMGHINGSGNPLIIPFFKLWFNPLELACFIFPLSNIYFQKQKLVCVTKLKIKVLERNHGCM